MSKKNVKTGGFSNEELPLKDQKWLKKSPTRMEVASYINALWERHYLPTITNYIQMSSMVLQAILIDKGVCTGDEIKSITEKFISEQQRRLARDTLEDGVISDIDTTVAKIKSGKWDVSTEDEKSAICSALDMASVTLTAINLHPPVNSDDIKACVSRLESIQSSVADGTIQSDNKQFMTKLTWLLTEATRRLNQRLQANEAKGDEKS